MISEGLKPKVFFTAISIASSGTVAVPKVSMWIETGLGWPIA